MSSSQILGPLQLRAASGVPQAAQLEMVLAPVLALFLTIILKRRFSSPLSNIPGPFLASATRL